MMTCRVVYLRGYVPVTSAGERDGVSASRLLKGQLSVANVALTKLTSDKHLALVHMSTSVLLHR